MRAVLKRACLAVLIWLAVQGGCFHRPTIPYISYYPDDPHVGQAVAFDVRFHYANAAATCSWDFGDGATSQDIWVFHTYTASGFYTVTVDGTTTEGTGFHTQEQVQVLNDPPSAYGQVAVTAADTPVDVTLSGSDPECFPLSFVIDVQPGSGTLEADNSFGYDGVSYTQELIDDTEAIFWTIGGRKAIANITKNYTVKEAYDNGGVGATPGCPAVLSRGDHTVDSIRMYCPH